MKVKEDWRWKLVKSSANNGFEKLVGVHTKALEDNSKGVIEILSILSERNLDSKSISQIKQIKKELKSIDRRLDHLGDDME